MAKTDDELIAEAMDEFDTPLPESTASEHAGEHLPGPLSPTLAALAEHRRPKLATVCETCQHSVWFSSPAEVKCYCRVMFLVTWSTKEPNQLTHCDGPMIGQEQ